MKKKAKPKPTPSTKPIESISDFFDGHRSIIPPAGSYLHAVTGQPPFCVYETQEEYNLAVSRGAERACDQELERVLRAIEELVRRLNMVGSKRNKVEWAQLAILNQLRFNLSQLQHRKLEPRRVPDGNEQRASLVRPVPANASGDVDPFALKDEILKPKA